MDIRKFARKPFYVEAVLVTPENMEEVAAWCTGTIMNEGDSFFIKVKVHRPLNKKQSEAHVGDWVLLSNTGWKVYTQVALENSFTLVEEKSSGRNVFESKDPEEDEIEDPNFVDAFLETAASADERVDPASKKQI